MGLSFLMALALLGAVRSTALSQEISVTGTVTEKSGFPLRGVTVRVTGGNATATTNQYGKYTILAPSNGELTFTLIGQKPGKASIGGRATVDITLERISFLEEVVVTAYSESQKRSEITYRYVDGPLDRSNAYPAPGASRDPGPFAGRYPRVKEEP